MARRLGISTILLIAAGWWVSFSRSSRCGDLEVVTLGLALFAEAFLVRDVA
jgi:hypothetical protein